MRVAGQRQRQFRLNSRVEGVRMVRQQNGEGIRLALPHQFAQPASRHPLALPGGVAEHPAQAEELNRMAANIGHSRLIQQKGHARSLDAPLELRAILEQDHGCPR